MDVPIEFRAKTPSSLSGDCPAYYKATGPEGGWVIQGKRLGLNTLARFRDRGADEEGVWIPDDLMAIIRSSDV